MVPFKGRSNERLAVDTVWMRLPLVDLSSNVVDTQIVVSRRATTLKGENVRYAQFAIYNQFARNYVFRVAKSTRKSHTDLPHTIYISMDRKDGE